MIFVCFFWFSDFCNDRMFWCGLYQNRIKLFAFYFNCFQEVNPFFEEFNKFGEDSFSFFNTCVNVLETFEEKYNNAQLCIVQEMNVWYITAGLFCFVFLLNAAVFILKRGRSRVCCHGCSFTHSKTRFGTCCRVWSALAASLC